MIDVSRIELSYKTFAQQFAVEEGLVFDLDVSVQRELLGHLAVQFRAKVLSDDLPPEHITARHRVTHEVPATTWQMWKKRHARRWYARRLVARWPVRYEPDPDGRGTDAVCTIGLERFRLYPRARLQLPPDQFGTAVYAHSIRGPWWHEQS